MWKFIRQKWLTLLLSVLLGSILWTYANRIETREGQLEAYFKLRYPADDLSVVLEPDVRIVTLTIRGPKGAIYEATRIDRDVRVIFGDEAIQQIADGKIRELHFTRSMVLGLPPDVEVTQFKPEGFTLTVHHRMEKLLPVLPPEIVGTPETGHEVHKIEVVRPREVLVCGPQDVLDKLAEVKPESVDVTGRHENYIDTERRIVRAYEIDGAIGRITCKSTVEIFIGIRRKSEQRTIEGVPVKIAQPESPPPGRGLDIELISPASPMDLELEGSPEALAQIKPDSICAFINIDVDKLKPDDNTPFKQLLIIWGLPEGVKPVGRIIVTARIRPKPESTPKPEHTEP